MATNSSASGYNETIPPNPEVAGFGVLIGFTSTTALTVGVLVVHFLAFYDPRLDPVLQHRDNHLNEDDIQLNPFDGWLLRAREGVRHWLIKYSSSSRWWNPFGAKCLNDRSQMERFGHFFEKLILRMCDAHFFAGYALLISGFVAVATEGDSSSDPMSFYHWQILLSCADCSLTTHIAGLIFLRRYFSTRPMERSFRLLCIAVFVLLLVFASLPLMILRLDTDSVRVFWMALFAPHGYEIFAIQQILDYNVFVTEAIHILFFVASFLLRSIEVSPGIFHCLFVVFRGWARRLALDTLSCLWREGDGCFANWWNQAFVRPLAAIFLVLRLYLDFFQSTSVKVVVTAMSNILGTYDIYHARLTTYGRPKADDVWTVGQISAALASAIPIFAIIVLFCKSRDKAPQHHNGTTPETVTEPSLELSTILSLAAIAAAAAAAPPSPPPPLHSHSHRQMTPERRKRQKQDYVVSLCYQAYVQSCWRPWACAIVAIYNVAAVMNTIPSYQAAKYGWDVTISLNTIIAWYFFAQAPILILFVLFSMGVESLILDDAQDRVRMDRGSGKGTRSMVLKVTTAILFMLFATLASLSFWDSLMTNYGPLISMWCLEHGFDGFNSVPFVPSESNIYLFENLRMGLLWWILSGLMAAYQFGCLCGCLWVLLNPWRWRCISPRWKWRGTTKRAEALHVVEAFV